MKNRTMALKEVLDQLSKEKIYKDFTWIFFRVLSTRRIGTKSKITDLSDCTEDLTQKELEELFFSKDIESLLKKELIKGFRVGLKEKISVLKRSEKIKIRNRKIKEENIRLAKLREREKEKMYLGLNLTENQKNILKKELGLI